MQIPEEWDEDLIKAWLKEAAETLSRVPGGYFRPRVTYWPDVVQTSVYALGSGGGRPGRPAASPKSIDRMEIVLTWLFACEDADERRLVWATACGIPWRKLEDMDGRSHVTLRKIHDRGLGAIQRKLFEQTNKMTIDQIKL